MSLIITLTSTNEEHASLTSDAAKKEYCAEYLLSEHIMTGALVEVLFESRQNVVCCCVIAGQCRERYEAGPTRLGCWA